MNLLRSTKENAFLVLCWVACVLKAEKFEIFSVMDANLAPLPQRIFAGAVRMDFGLAFMTPRHHTVNVAYLAYLAYKHTSAGEYGFWLRYFVYFL